MYRGVFRVAVLLLVTALGFGQTIRYKVPPPKIDQNPETRNPAQQTPTTQSVEKQASKQETALARRAVDTADSPAPLGWVHRMVQFDAPPTAGQLDAVRKRGARVLQDAPDNAVLISIDLDRNRDVDLSGQGVIAAHPMPAYTKISPLIVNGLSPLIPMPVGSDFVVEFHPDVDMNTARGILLLLGWDLHESPDIGAHHLLVSGQEADAVSVLAERDEVAYVFPASTQLIQGIPVIPCASALTLNGTLGQYIATAGNGWDGPGLGSAALMYVFNAATTKLPPAQAWSEIQRAMNEWSKVAAVTWTQSLNPVAANTVNVLFATGNHGDPYPFDGPGNVLAHTFYPAPPNPEPIAGDMHFDDDETWRIGVNIDLYSVALHELGHALGLGHSDDPNAVMYPYYRMVDTLQADDKRAILTLYAPAPDPTPSPAPVPDPRPAPAPDPAPVPDPTPPPSTPPPPTPAPTPTPTPAPADTTAPTLAILNPASSTTSTTAISRTVTGTAYDAGGLASVTWLNSLGGSGTATGTTNWSAAIPLIRGMNRVTVTAVDKAGNNSWRTVVITRQ